MTFQPRCSNCACWNTYSLQAPAGLDRNGASPSGAPARRLDSPGLSPGRMATGIPFFDRVTGGGLVAGSSILIYGAPGAGKSTLAAQVAFWAAVRVKRPGLVVSGEEWIVQVRDRVDRLGLAPGWLWFNSPVDLSLIEADLRRLKPSLLVIDSVQKLEDPADKRGGGEMDHARRALVKLLHLLRDAGCSALLLSQVNKSGEPLGGRFYEHEPDGVYELAAVPEQPQLRELRTKKNRFGPESRVGLRMTATGLVEQT